MQALNRDASQVPALRRCRASAGMTCAWFAAAATALAMAMPASAQDCDEACLRAAADSFLAALVANDPSLLTYNAYARYTENGQELEFGDALWTTTTAAPDRYRIYVPDTQTGQIALIATIEEFGNPSIMAARIKLERGRFSEIETIVNRQDEGSISDYAALDTPDPQFAEVLAPGDRRPREELLRIADLYFEAIEDDNGDRAPFSDRCVRVENGAVTAGRANRPNPPASGSQPGEFGASGCREQLSRGTFDFISSIAPRRFEVVDVTRGLVFGVFMFNHDGDRKQITLNDGAVMDAPAFALSPSSTLIGELFRIDAGEIVRVEAVGEMMHYGSPTGWDDE